MCRIGSGMMYLIVFSNGDRYCRYQGEDSVADKVCLSLGGTNKSGDTYWDYTQYKLP